MSPNLSADGKHAMRAHDKEFALPCVCSLAVFYKVMRSTGVSQDLLDFVFPIFFVKVVRGIKKG